MTAIRSRWLGLIAISLGVALIIVDGTIVNVAVPYIVRDLHLTSTEVQWVQESYTLVFAATLLVLGVLADSWGRRRLLIAGTVLFALASIVAATSGTGPLLILTRVLQGIGGAMLLPTSLSLINANFPAGRERGLAFAVWGSTIGGMAAVGPLLGGWLTTASSWRWAFGINPPIGAVVVVGALLHVAESRSRSTGRIDWAGAALVAVGCAALAFGLIEGRQYGWWTTGTRLQVGDWAWPYELSPVPVAFALAVVGLGGFVLRGIARMRRGRPNLLDFRLFRTRSFRNGNLVAMLVSLGEFGIILSLPIWLQNVQGLTALQTGLVLLALAIGSFAASGLAATLGARLAPLTVVRLGLVAEIAGVAAAGLAVQPDTGWGWLVPCLLVYGVGVGLATAQLTGVVLAELPVRLSGEGSGIQATSRQIGAALGIAILGTVLFTTVGDGLAARLRELGVPAPARTSLVSAVVDSAGGAISGLGASAQTKPMADAARAAFSEGTAFSAYTAAGFLVLGLLATLSLGARRGSTGTGPERGRAAGEATTAAPPAS